MSHEEIPLLHHHEHPDHHIEHIDDEEQTSLVVAHGHHIYSFATLRMPVKVYVSVVPDSQQGCGNDQDQDTVHVTLHPNGFDIVCDITSDSCRISWFVETV